MSPLFPADKHCALRDEVWSASRAKAAVRDILRHDIASFDPEALWPRHPLDGDDPMRSGYYFGAGGVFWGVSFLSREGWAEQPWGWFDEELGALEERNVAERADYELDASRSYLFGDIPLLMLQHVHQPRAALADQLFMRLEVALEGPVHELMWGVPGHMLAALHLFAATAQERWLELYRRQARRLLAAAEHVPGVGLHWRSERRGKVYDGLGAVHGFAGNVLALLRGFQHLPEEQQSLLLQEVPKTLLATATRVGGRDGGRANWPRSPSTPQPWRVYHCHGAPGIVSRFAQHALWQVERGWELFAQGRHSLDGRHRGGAVPERMSARDGALSDARRILRQPLPPHAPTARVG